MPALNTLLCIHRDPVQLDLLKEAGYALVTAINGSEGLRVLMSRPVDAIVIEYYLGLLNGADVAYEIKQVNPQIPVVMIADQLDMSEEALKWVDAFVTKSDGPHFLLSTVQSVLPTKPPTEVERDGVQASRRPTGRSIPKASKYLILVVDDDPIVRENISVLLMAAGYNVVLAEDGFAALVQLRKTAPDFLISDLNMPGMSGFELLSVVRRRFPEILTLAMSGGAYARDELPFGVIADAFLTKTGQSEPLFSTLRQLLGTGPARRSDHYRKLAPAWIPRNGNDSQGLAYVMLTCPECLRAFQMNLLKEISGVLEIPCRFCQSTNKYIIEPD